MFESKFADMTMGNILLGGVIGAVVDASSGASHEYDPIVTLTMIPVRFASTEDRDAFFDKMRDNFIQGTDESMKLIAEKCKPQMCDYEKEEAEKARVAKLAEIENEREIALIGDSIVAVESKQAGKDKQSGSDTTASLSGAAEQSAGVTKLTADWGTGKVR